MVVCNAFLELDTGESYPMATFFDQNIQELFEWFPTANMRGISNQEKIIRPANQGKPMPLNDTTLIVIVVHPFDIVCIVTLAFLVNDNSC